MPNALTLTPPPSIPADGRPTRDGRLLSFVGRHGAVSISHLMAAGGLGQSATYDRVAALIDARLLERLDLLRGEPALLRATRAGLRYAGLGMAPVVVSPGSVDHWLRCATVALDLEARHGSHRVLSARELISAERHEGRPVASAKLGELPDGRPRLHRPDLVVLPSGHPLTRDPSLDAPRGIPSLAAHARTREQGGEIPGEHEPPPAEAEDMRVISVEVELTPKSPRRLREIIRGWRRASWVAEVHYLCEPGQTRRAVERAVEKLHGQDRIRIEEVPR